MSAEEAASWEAWMRLNPSGFDWENLRHAMLLRSIVIAGRNGSSKDVPDLDVFKWKPPEPLLATRLRAEAKARAALAAREKPKAKRKKG